MKKTIILTDGSKIKVETEGSLFGFMAGDVVTRDKDAESSSSHWKNKKVFIEGFWDGKMWGTIDGEKNSLFCEDQNGLILLERPGLKFKVGNDVVAIGGDPKKKIGKINVIDPYEDGDLPFLVEFKHLTFGQDAYEVWEKPWYPECCKTASNSKFWMSENNLKFLNEK